MYFILTRLNQFELAQNHLTIVMADHKVKFENCCENNGNFNNKEKA